MPPASEWPYRYPLCPALPDGPVEIRASNISQAYVNAQTGTQLVTTQKAYLDAEWDAALTRHGDARLAITESAEAHVTHPLAIAFRLADPAERLARCVEFLKTGRTAAGTRGHRERVHGGQRFRGGRPRPGRGHRASARVGRRSLRARQALAAPRRHGQGRGVVPSRGGAAAGVRVRRGRISARPWASWIAPTEALAAFEHALALDPLNPQALNNVGVVRRELGRLAESEAAFRQVIPLTPDLAFGHYNLGHTLFLQGRFQAALSAYADGQARDPERNPVQASRLALCKLATGDAGGALRELQRATGAAARVSAAAAGRHQRHSVGAGDAASRICRGGNRCKRWVAGEIAKGNESGGV